MRIRLLVALAASLSLASCPKVEPGGVKCTRETDCLSGQSCADGTCQACPACAAGEICLRARCLPGWPEQDLTFLVSKITVKERLKINRQTMPEQLATIRNANFAEVNLGLPEQVAIMEAQRCLQCKEPKCMSGCPVNVNISQFIDFVAQGDMRAAALSLLSDNALPAVTGRVCPQETQCECECVRGFKGLPVAIGYLERYVADWAREHEDQLSTSVASPTQIFPGESGASAVTVTFVRAEPSPMKAGADTLPARTMIPEELWML